MEATRAQEMEWQAADLLSILRQHPLPELSGQRLFLSGATGFIGRWLLQAVRCLNEAGASIEVCALSRDPDAFLARAPEWQAQPWLTWVRGDIRDFPYPELMPTAILHGATETSAQFAARYPDALFESIVRGAEHLLRFAVSRGRPRVLLLSSGAVYGEQPADLPALPEDRVLPDEASSSASAYARGKREMERLARYYSDTEGIDTICARCFTFIGHGLAPHLAISQFIRDARVNPTIVINGDGLPIRSYLYAADLAVWLLTILLRGTPRRAYNVGSPEPFALIEAARRVQMVLAPDKRVETRHADAPGARRCYVPDTRRAERELGLRVWTPFDEALRKTARSGTFGGPEEA